MAPLKEAVLLPHVRQNAKSTIMRRMIDRRIEEVRRELAAMHREALFEEARKLLLREEVGFSELVPIFIHLGILNQNGYVGAIELALLLKDDDILKSAVEYAKENGANVFEIRKILWEEGAEQKADFIYPLLSSTSLQSYEKFYSAAWKYLGGDVERIKSAVALLHTREKTIKALRNEYRKKESVKEYATKLKKWADDELSRVSVENFSVAVYRAYFDDVHLQKQDKMAWHYLKLISDVGIFDGFTCAIVNDALRSGERRVREKALRIIRDFKLNVNVESALRSENMNERVLALRIMLEKGWNEIFREMLFSEFYKEREIALRAFLKYSPKISEKERERIQKLARVEIGKCEKLAKEILKKTAEMGCEKQTLKLFAEKVRENLGKVFDASRAYVSRFKSRLVEKRKRMETAKQALKVFSEKAKESSARVFDALKVYSHEAYRKMVEFSKNVFAYLDYVAFRLRLEWIEKRAKMIMHAKRINKMIWGSVFSLTASFPVFANDIKSKVNALALSLDLRTALGYFFILATMAFATSLNHQTKNRWIRPKERVVQALDEEKKKRKERVHELVQKILNGDITLSDALMMIKNPTERQELTNQLKKTEPPKKKPKPIIEMDEKTRKMYEKALGVIAITKGMESFEFNRAMLVDQYYSQNVGANKWINILIFGDNTAWTFPTADLGNSLDERESVNVGDILLNHVGSGYVLSDDLDSCYLVAYHDAKNGLRIMKFTFEQIKSEFDRVLTTEEANEFAKQKICEELNLDPNQYNVVVKQLVFPTDYNCDRHWDDSLNCLIGNAHDYGAPREGGTRTHEGTDLYAPFGAPIYSPVDGVVVEAGWGGSKAGLRVWIKGVDGYYYMMAHLDRITVNVDQLVTAGTEIGNNGDTGNAKGLAAVGAAHTHQEVHKEGRNNPRDDNPIDPDQRLYDLWFVGLEQKQVASYLNNSE
ncbi:MAG: M23 family metallopeptidase [Candidatus Anstonellales archaeon]